MAAWRVYHPGVGFRETACSGSCAFTVTGTGVC